MLVALFALAPWTACQCGQTSGSKGTTSATSSSAGGGASTGGTSSGTATSSSGGLPGVLAFVPPAQTLTLDGTGSQSASYSLQLTNGSGNVSDVTADSVQFDRPDLALVTPGEPVVATAPSAAGLYAGTGTIHAVYKGLTATATLTVQFQLIDYGPGLSATSPAVIALGKPGLPTDPAPDISPLLYPYDQTIWPLGLTSPLLMWNAPQAGDVYRLPALADRQFDAILAQGLLHHLDDYAVGQLFRFAAQKLAPGGRMVTVDPCYHDRQGWLEGFLMDHDRGRNVRTQRAYEALARQAFGTVRSELRNDAARFAYTYCYVVAGA